MRNYKYIYGPVSSWRLGRSLGIDIISTKIKACTFDCIYCQLGRAKASSCARKIFVPTENIIREIKALPRLKIDYITFSGSGEPTLAANLGRVIRAVKKIRKEKIAVITNSSLMYRKSVQRDLLPADFVIAKIDAHSQDVFKKINKPFGQIKLNKIITGLIQFRHKFKKKLAAQIMFSKENKKYAKQISEIVKKINPDEIQLNTPLRPSSIKPLAKNKLQSVAGYFKGTNYSLVYSAKRKNAKPISKNATDRRRGND